MLGFIDMYGDMVECEVELWLNVCMLFEFGLCDFDRCFVVFGVMIVYVVLFFSLVLIYGYLCSYEYISSVICVIKIMCDQLLVDYKVYVCFEIIFFKVFVVIEELIVEGFVDLILFNDYMLGQDQYCNVECYVERFVCDKGMSFEEVVQLIVWCIEECIQFVDVMMYMLDVIFKVCYVYGVVIVSYDDDIVVKVQLMYLFGVLISEFLVIFEVVVEVKRFGLMNVMGVLNVLCGQFYLGNFLVCDVYVVGLLDILVVDYYFLVILLVVLELLKIDKYGFFGVCWLVMFNLVQVFGFFDCGEIVVGKKVDFFVVDDNGIGYVCCVFWGGCKIYFDGLFILVCVV